MFQTKFADEVKTHILRSTTFLSENGVVCMTMWINIAEPGRPQMTMWRMHI